MRTVFRLTLADAMKDQKWMVGDFLAATIYSVQGGLKYEAGKTWFVRVLDDWQSMVMLHIESEAAERSIAALEQESILRCLLARFAFQVLIARHLHIGSSFQVAEAGNVERR